MYQRDLKIQKGLKNKIQFQFKNSDQKPVDITSSTFTFSMFDAINQRQLVSKQLTILDDGATRSLKGLALLEITESDTLDLDNSQYQFTVSALDDDGSYEPTYANTYYAISGNIELRRDSFPVLQPSYTVTDFQPHHDYLQTIDVYYSGNIPSHPEFSGHTALHTVSYHMTNYRGEVWVEGTLENSPQYFGHFVEIAGTRKIYGQGLFGYTGQDYVNFNGVWSYVRVMYQPTPDPVSGRNDSSSIEYRGTFDKSIYRS
jgi:hypothetical protein